MGGKKRKIAIKIIENKFVQAVTFTKRRHGLYRKASELCRLSHATQIAILATPLSSNSHASFYSFGHPSVDHVVSSLLHDHHDSPDLSTNQESNTSRLGFWWEDESFDTSENIEDLKYAFDAVTRMMNNVKLRLDSMRSNQRDGGLVIHQNEEKNLQLSNVETNQTHGCERPFGYGSLLENEEDQLQLTNHETSDQITRFGGSSDYGSMLENLDIDELLTDSNIELLLCDELL